MQAVRVKWLTGTYPILLFEVDADFTIDDYLKAVAKAWQLLDTEAIDRFYVVADVSGVNRIPPQMVTAMFKEYGKTHPAFAGITIFIGAPRFIQRLVEQFQNLFHTSKFAFADHINDLDRVITQHLQRH